MSVELEDNEDTHADWLGGIFGAREEIKLPARCKEVLQYAFDNGILEDDSIPEDGVVLEKDDYKMFEDLFVGGLKDACSESKKPHRTTEEGPDSPPGPRFASRAQIRLQGPDSPPFASTRRAGGYTLARMWGYARRPLCSTAAAPVDCRPNTPTPFNTSPSPEPRMRISRTLRPAHPTHLPVDTLDSVCSCHSQH